MVVFLKEMYLKNVFTGVVLHVSIRIMDHGYEREEKKVNERKKLSVIQFCSALLWYRGLDWNGKERVKFVQN